MHVLVYNKCQYFGQLDFSVSSHVLLGVDTGGGGGGSARLDSIPPPPPPHTHEHNSFHIFRGTHKTSQTGNKTSRKFTAFYYLKCGGRGC